MDRRRIARYGPRNVFGEVINLFVNDDKATATWPAKLIYRTINGALSIPGVVEEQLAKLRMLRAKRAQTHR